MKPESIIIQNGGFAAAITTETLLVLPLRNVRKLFRMLPLDQRNEEAVRVLKLWLSHAESEAKEDWRDASDAYRHGHTEAYRLGYTAMPNTPENGRARQVAEIKKRNKTLLAAVKKAKNRYDRIVKIHTIFKGECTYET